MKCISLMQPWATLVVCGLKQYETRRWSTAHRGLLAIHASKRFDYEVQVLCEQEPFKSLLAKAGYADRNLLPRGALLGTVELVDCMPTNLLHPPDEERSLGDFRPGRFAWKLVNLQRLEVPVAMAGRLGIYEIAAPALSDLTAATSIELP
jgi:hypothetical protein